MLKEFHSCRFTGSLSVFLFVGLVFGGVFQAAAQDLQQPPVPSRISGPVDDAVRVTIPRSMHPMAQAKFDRGPVEPGAPMERMILVLGISPEQEHQLRTFLDSQQTKGSPDYHHWLTPQEFGQKFGPSAQDLQQATAWLQSQGFNVGAIARSGRWIEFSGTAAQVKQAFRTEMRTFQVEGKLHTANNADISIPAALAPVVQGVASLHNFVKKPMHTRGDLVTRQPDATLHDQQNNIIHALAPGDFANIYNLNPLFNATPTAFNGAGVTIALVARSDIDPNDFSGFKSQFTGANHLNQILNGPDPGLVQGDQEEATLDAEWSSAVAPGATIDLVVSSSTATTDGVDLSAGFIVDNNLASVMSTSFSACEAGLSTAENNFFNSLWEQAAAQGISSFVSAGDDGAAGCADPNTAMATGTAAVNGLASTPFNTAVGGTQFDETIGGGNDATFWNTANATGLISVKGYIPEKVWNESCAAATCGANANLFSGSGGQSKIYSAPTWQMSTGIPGLNFANRALPDVSLAAAGHDGYIVCLNGSCQGGQFFIFAGTSASSPSFAGIMAIIDQKTGGRQGLANYVLYSLAKAETFNNCNSNSRSVPTTPPSNSCIFNDVTTGNNSVPGLTGFSAGPGFDLASGLGSVNAAALVNAFPNQPAGFLGTTTALSTTATTPIVITHGTSVPFTVGVTRTAGTATPSGAVSLIASGGTLTGQVGVAATTISGTGGTGNGSFAGVSNLPGGTAYSLVANYPGDGTFGASSSTGITVTVNAEGSTTTLNSFNGVTNQGIPIAGTTTTYGGFLVLSTVVKSATNASPPDGFPSGLITINDNAVSIGTLTLNGKGQAELINCTTPTSLTTPCFTVGSHPITVAYGGDNGFTASAPASGITITVNKAATTGSVKAPTTAAFNTPITLTANIDAFGPIQPTGTVQFFQGNTSLGSPVTVTPGNPSTASMQATLTGSGNQTVTSQYSGDGTYNAATVGPSTVAVTQPFSFTAATSAQTITAGMTATFNVTLNGVGGFTSAVNFNCTGATGGATCSVSPNPANLSATTTSIPLTVTVSNTTNARLAPGPFKTIPWVFAAAIAGLVLGMKRRGVKRRPGQALLMVLAVALIVGVGSCGGSGTPQHIPAPPTVDTLTVTGTGGTATNSVNLTLTINHQ
jgi:hypothetical protein